MAISLTIEQIIKLIIGIAVLTGAIFLLGYFFKDVILNFFGKLSESGAEVFLAIA